MSKNSKLFYSFLAVSVSVLITVILYGYGKYACIEESSFSTIQITHHTKNIRSEGFTIYALGQNESKFDYTRPYKLSAISDSVLSVKLDDNLKIKAFRCYFEYPGENIEIRSIDLLSSTKRHSIDLNQKVNSHGLKWTKDEEEFHFEVIQSNGYFDTPKHFLYPSDFESSYKFWIPIILVISLLAYLVYKIDFSKIHLKSMGIPEISLAILILTEFLPAPIYNVALILGIVLNLRRIDFNKIKQNKINLIFLVFFVIYLLNNLLLTDNGYTDLSTVELFLPFLILAVLIPTIAQRGYLILFPVSAIVIGSGLLVTSIFEVFVNHNMIFLSFRNFSKYLHPVYYSYLLFFSIIYIQFHYFGKLKYFILFVLFSFLVFSGSKMVLIFSLLALIVNFIKSKKIILIFIPLSFVVFFFSPLKNRFSEILNQDDLSILREEKITNVNDTRINGLTFRLILWREALKTMDGFDYLVGKGVTDQSNKLLETRLVNLGLISHKNFNPHNQYVDTFWRTGVIGLVFLILIPIYSLVNGIKRKDKLLIQFSLFMFAVMWSESIFGRVNGVYFFSTIILILMNSTKSNEDSNIRN